MLGILEEIKGDLGVQEFNDIIGRLGDWGYQLLAGRVANEAIKILSNAKTTSNSSKPILDKINFVFTDKSPPPTFWNHKTHVSNILGNCCSEPDCYGFVRAI